MCLWGLELVVELKCKKLALFGGVENTLEHWVLVLAGGCGDRRVIYQRLSPAYKALALVSIFMFSFCALSRPQQLCHELS